MRKTIDTFFEVDNSAFYYNKYGERKFRGVKHYYGDTVRNDKAAEQAKLSTVPISAIFCLVNDFLEMNREQNGYTSPIVRCDYMKLDDVSHIIIDNGMIVRECDWIPPTYSVAKRKYIDWDRKYDLIKDKFHLEQPNNIVWLKFTKDGYLAVVARSFDINFDDSLSSGILVNEVGKQLDCSFVLVFPLTNEILGTRTVEELELGIGNYLIHNGVPIIDYYSHNN